MVFCSVLFLNHACLVFMLLGMEPRALLMPGKCSTIDLRPTALGGFFETEYCYVAQASIEFTM
jgi:hypothetical protein